MKVMLVNSSPKQDGCTATALGIVASHVWYGIQFLRGLCADHAPCEYIGKDHART